MLEIKVIITDYALDTYYHHLFRSCYICILCYMCECLSLNANLTMILHNLVFSAVHGYYNSPHYNVTVGDTMFEGWRQDKEWQSGLIIDPEYNVAVNGTIVAFKVHD